jgi:hypothetical protein
MMPAADRGESTAQCASCKYPIANANQILCEQCAAGSLLHAAVNFYQVAERKRYERR